MVETRNLSPNRWFRARRHCVARHWSQNPTQGTAYGKDQWYAIHSRESKLPKTAPPAEHEVKRPVRNSRG